MANPRRGTLVSSFRHAFEGLGCVLQRERNARIHLWLAMLTVVLGAWLRLTPIEWALIVAAIALVFAGEMLNTVVEITLDLVIKEVHPQAKAAKDIAAGAVLVVSVAAAVIGVVILGPHLLHGIGLGGG